MKQQQPKKITDYKAAVFDMDGVVTQTATVHARAWKKMFDDFLRSYSQRHNLPFQEFDMESDYRDYVDGLPRFEGVHRFLASRGIELEEGSEEDPEDSETVFGLGKRKNNYFNQVLEQEGVQVYPDWLEQVYKWRQQGMKTAIVSSSRNCRAVIAAGGVEHLFDTRVDGEVSRQLNLKGKPDPDIFIEAANRLQVVPAEAVVFEDAVFGVQSGKAGKFGLVVGVAHKQNHQQLLDNGADVAVEKLTELV